MNKYLALGQKNLEDIEKAKIRGEKLGQEINNLLDINNREIATSQGNIARIDSTLEDNIKSRIAYLFASSNGKPLTAKQKQELDYLEEEFTNLRLTRIETQLKNNEAIAPEDQEFLISKTAEKKTKSTEVGGELTNRARLFLASKGLANDIAQIQPIADVKLNDKGETPLSRLLIKKLGANNVRIGEAGEYEVKLPNEKEFTPLPGAAILPNVGRFVKTLGSGVVGAAAGSPGGPLGILGGEIAGSGLGEAQNVIDAINFARANKLVDEKDKGLVDEAVKQGIATGGLSLLFGTAPVAGKAVKGIATEGLDWLGKALTAKGFLGSSNVRKMQGILDDKMIAEQLQTEFSNVNPSTAGEIAQQAIGSFVASVQGQADNAFAIAEKNFMDKLNAGTPEFVNLKDPWTRFKNSLVNSADTADEKEAAKILLKDAETKLNATRNRVLEGRMQVSPEAREKLFGKTDFVSKFDEIDPITGQTTSQVLQPKFDPNKITSFDVRLAVNDLKDVLDGLENTGKIVGKKTKSVVTNFLESLKAGDALGEFKDGYEILKAGYNKVPTEVRERIVGRGINTLDPSDAQQALFKLNREDAAKVRDIVKKYGPTKDAAERFTNSIKQTIFGPKSRFLSQSVKDDLSPEAVALSQIDTTKQAIEAQRQGLKLDPKQLEKMFFKPGEMSRDEQIQTFAGNTVLTNLVGDEAKKGTLKSLLGENFKDTIATAKQLKGAQDLADRPSNLMQMKDQKGNNFFQSLLGSLPIPRDTLAAPGTSAGAVLGGLGGLVGGGVPGAIGGAIAGGTTGGVLTNPAALRFYGDALQAGSKAAGVIPSGKELLGIGQVAAPELTPEEFESLKLLYGKRK